MGFLHSKMQIMAQTPGNGELQQSWIFREVPRCCEMSVWTYMGPRAYLEGWADPGFVDTNGDFASPLNCGVNGAGPWGFRFI